jgi:putative SOS response-associated peptidase YedK
MIPLCVAATPFPLSAQTLWRRLPRYEWKAEETVKQPYALTLKDGKVCMFAGLWSRWRPPDKPEPIYTMAILTREASFSAAGVHSRMPVILHPMAWPHWIQSLVTDRQAIREVLINNTLLEVRSWKVSKLVSSPKSEGRR